MIIITDTGAECEPDGRITVRYTVVTHRYTNIPDIVMCIYIYIYLYMHAGVHVCIYKNTAGRYVGTGRVGGTAVVIRAPGHIRR